MHCVQSNCLHVHVFRPLNAYIAFSLIVNWRTNNITFHSRCPISLILLGEILVRTCNSSSNFNWSLMLFYWLHVLNAIEIIKRFYGDGRRSLGYAHKNNLFYLPFEVARFSSRSSSRWCSSETEAKIVRTSRSRISRNIFPVSRY